MAIIDIGSSIGSDVGVVSDVAVAGIDVVVAVGTDVAVAELDAADLTRLVFLFIDQLCIN